MQQDVARKPAFPPIWHVLHELSEMIRNAWTEDRKANAALLVVTILLWGLLYGFLYGGVLDYTIVP